MRILITGAEGFIGANLRTRLRECGNHDIVSITRDSSDQQLAAGLASADFIYHLAGVNRPKTDDEFVQGNQKFTERLCAALVSSGRRTPVVFSSSTQAAMENPYGQSKLAAETVL